MPAPIDRSVLPADVRAADRESQKLYESAVQLERTFVERLAQQLTASTWSDDEEGGGGTEYARSLLPGALADGVAAAGGLGLAHDLWRALVVQQGGDDPAATDADAAAMPTDAADSTSGGIA